MQLWKVPLLSAPWSRERHKTQKAWFRQIAMGHSRIACDNVWHQSKDSCGALNVDVLDSVELTEQTDSLAAKQTIPMACVSGDLKCGRAREVCDKSKDIAQLITWRKRDVERGNGQPSTFRVRLMEPLLIAHWNYCQCNVRDHLKQWVAHLYWTFPNTYTVS